jgi:hypothetical protein
MTNVHDSIPERTEECWPQCPTCHARRTTRCPICNTFGSDFSHVDADYAVASEAAADEAEPAGSCSCGTGACGTAASDEGDATSIVDEQTPTEGVISGPMLICPTCDEPFAPQYARLCEWCGHQFPDGYDVESEEAAEAITGRAIALCLGLVAVVIAVLGWFVLVL